MFILSAYSVPIDFYWFVFFDWSYNMITKAEVYQEEFSGKTLYTVCPSIKLGSYYKRTKNKIVCTDKDEVSKTVSDVLHNKVCPECGHIFSGKNWDSIDTHWRAYHEGIMSYENAWKLLENDKYVSVILESAE
ncbi:MAG: hypothetical protein V3U87_12225 [Methylococcaceae bacterium]